MFSLKKPGTWMGRITTTQMDQYPNRDPEYWVKVPEHICSQRRGLAMAWAGEKGSEPSVTEHIHTGLGGPPVWDAVMQTLVQDKQIWAELFSGLFISRILGLELSQGRGVSKRPEAGPAVLRRLCF